MYCARVNVKPTNRRRRSVESPCITFQSWARLYMNAVSMVAEQARCHGQRNLLDELWTVKSAMPVRVLLLFALAGTHFRPVGSVKTLCTYRVHCTRRCAALRGKARRWGATERAPSQAKKTCSAKHIHANNLGLNTSYIWLTRVS